MRDDPRKRRVLWGLADQAVSSASNFALGIVVARSVPALDFGAFALVFALFTVGLSLSRAATTEPFLVRYSASRDPHAVRVAGTAATGAAVTLGAALGIVALTTSVLVGPQLAPVLAAFGAVLPLVFLQDAWRMVFFATRGEGKALANDVVWLVALGIGVVLVLTVAGQPTAAHFVVAWGLSAGVAAAVGSVQSGWLPRPRATRRWLTEHRDLWPRFAGESVLISGAPQLYSVVIAACAGLVAVGQLRLVMIVLGPVNVIIQGVGLIALPEAVRAFARSRAALVRTTIAISGVIAAGAALWGVAVAAVPTDVWTAVAGAGWAAAAVLTLPLVLQQVLNGANTGAHTGLRAMEAAARSLRTRVLTSSLLVVVPSVVVATTGSIAATAWSLVGVAAVNLVVWWWQFGRTASVVRQLVPAGTEGVRRG